MKTFKKIDCIVQLLLFALAFVFYLLGARHPLFSNDQFFSLYFIIGGWQLVSFLVHALKPVYNKKVPRRVYLFLLLLVIIGAAISWGNDMFRFFYILLFVSPAMAVYYLIVCGIETKAIKEKQDTVQ